MFKLLDLFSGIGGFSLAARWTGKIETVAFCEIDPFCQKVLKRHWPEVPIISDIREVTGERIREIIADAIDERLFRGCGRSYTDSNGIQEGEQAGYKSWGATTRCNERHIDILTGGFPCQPFSCAGKRAGKEDNRYLWPEMLRVIRQVKPTWVIAENVRGLLSISNGLVFEGCCTDMEALGYEVQPFVIPACAVNAPHRRDRVWIIAHNAQRAGQQGSSGRIEAKQNSHGPEDGLLEQTDCHAPNTRNERLQGGKRAGAYDEGQAAHGSVAECHSTWHEPWIEVATRLCRVDDGLPGKLAGRGRVNKLKALGNAIVPQVAYEIFKAIMEAEND